MAINNRLRVFHNGDYCFYTLFRGIEHLIYGLYWKYENNLFASKYCRTDNEINYFYDCLTIDIPEVIPPGWLNRKKLEYISDDDLTLLGYNVIEDINPTLLLTSYDVFFWDVVAVESITSSVKKDLSQRLPEIHTEYVD